MCRRGVGVMIASGRQCAPLWCACRRWAQAFYGCILLTCQVTEHPGAQVAHFCAIHGHTTHRQVQQVVLSGWGSKERFLEIAEQLYLSHGGNSAVMQIFLHFPFTINLVFCKLSPINFSVQATVDHSGSPGACQIYQQHAFLVILFLAAMLPLIGLDKGNLNCDQG